MSIVQHIDQITSIPEDYLRADPPAPNTEGAAALSGTMCDVCVAY